jgi:hypothetical protein
VLTTGDDLARASKVKSFEGAAWFKDEFRFMEGKSAKNQRSYVAPKALFNLDGDESRKTIHDRHKHSATRGDKVMVGTPPQGDKEVCCRG